MPIRDNMFLPMKFAFWSSTLMKGALWIFQPPGPVVVGSHTIEVSRCLSKCLFCVISATNFNLFLKAVLSSGDQLSGLFFSVFFNSGRKAAAI